MKYCSYCSVELDDTMDICPLCFTNASDELTDVREQERESVRASREFPDPDSKNLTPLEKRKLFWELSVLILVSGIVVTLLIDLLTSKGITWSKYTITICVAFFIDVSLLSFWRNRRLIFLGGTFLTQSLLLVLFDTYTFNIGWGIKLGIPILAIFYLAIIAFMVIIRITKKHGLNIIGYFFIISGTFTVGIECIIDKYFFGYIVLGWSLFVVVSIVPIALILFFVHFRLKKGRELRRLFHI